MTKKEAINDFLSQKNLAILGVSRDKRKFGNTIFKDMRKKGYNMIPIHPEIATMENEKCYKSLAEIPIKVNGVILNIKPKKTEEAVKEVHASGIKRVWMQQGSESKSAIEYCIKNGIEVVSGECIFMFAEPMAFFHKPHKWVWRIIGRLPA